MQPAAVQGLAVGFDPATREYHERSLCPPCQWVSTEHVQLAGVVHTGLFSIAQAVSALGAGPNKPVPFSSGMWGWHVAECWVRHIKDRVIAFGPMAAWHRCDGWHFVKAPDGQTIPKKFVIGLACKASNQLYQQ